MSDIQVGGGEVPEVLRALEEGKLQQDDSAKARKSGGQKSCSNEGLERPELWTDGSPYLYYLDPCKSDPWVKLKSRIDKYDAETCKGWTDDLDTMLVFTGLFSAILTAFCIESFTHLAQDPTDTTNALLIIISQQLANTSASMANHSVSDNFQTATKDVEINVFYFLSLVLALSVSSVCLLAKQWIREYQRDIAVSALDAVRVRQIRLDALHAWKVPQILSALPVLLQIALISFFAGLQKQLWNVSDRTTAAVVFIIVDSTMVLIFVTTFAPAHCSEKGVVVPFRSAQAWLYCIACQQIRRLFNRGEGVVKSWAELDMRMLHQETMSEVSEKGVTSVHRALRWVYEVLRNSDEMEKCLLQCLQPSNLSPTSAGMSSQGNAIHISRYVVSGSLSMEQVNVDSVHRVLYELSTVGVGYSTIGTARGRFQAELVIRGANVALDSLDEYTYSKEDYGRLHKGLAEGCYSLACKHDIFLANPDEERDHYKDSFQSQAALVLSRFFHIMKDSEIEFLEEMNWTYIFLLLFALMQRSTSTFGRSLAEEIMCGDIPSFLHRHRSTSLLRRLAKDLVQMEASSDVGVRMRLFEALDRCMVEIGGIEDFEDWNTVRKEMIREANRERVIMGLRVFSNNYFNDLYPSPV